MFDLHMHSTFSDGSDSPERLLQLVKEKGLSGFSITDHDTIDAYSDELFAKAKEMGLELIPGVEFSTQLEGTSNICSTFCPTTQRNITAPCSALTCKLSARLMLSHAAFRYARNTITRLVTRFLPCLFFCVVIQRLSRCRFRSQIHPRNHCDHAALFCCLQTASQCP